METTICPICSGRLHAHSETCESCGARFEVTRKGYCPGCKEVMELGSDGSCRRCRALAVCSTIELTPRGGPSVEVPTAAWIHRLRARPPEQRMSLAVPPRCTARRAPIRPTSARPRFTPSGRAITLAVLIFAFLVVCFVAGLLTSGQQHSISALTDRVRAPAAQTRIDAPRELAGIRSPQAISVLTWLVEDKDLSVRLFVIRKLADIGGPQVVAPIAGRLESENVQKVSEAIRALAKLRDPAAVGPLITCVQEGKAAAEAEGALAAIGKLAVGPLAAAHCCHTLSVLEKKLPGSTEPLPSFLAQGDIKNVAAWYDYYIYLGSPGSEGVLVKALNRYGDKNMARTYMNCGNPVLEEAGRTWFLENGYGLASVQGPSQESSAGSASWGI